jgi:hypothetical protein
MTKLLLAFLLLAVACHARTVTVSDHGAVGDGTTLNTHALQQAIDACHASGGGKVVFSAGNYITGTLFLKSNVILHLEAGATLAGSTNFKDYAPNVFRNQYADRNKKEGCLIFAENAANIGIEGKGKIDGRGHRSNFPHPDDPKKDRPMLLRFLRCTNVSLENVELVNPASWTLAMIYCRRVNIQGVTIHAKVNSNGDGLDFDGCENVTISNCVMDTSDDSICLQSSRPDTPCRLFTITNCIMTSLRAAIRIGMLSTGDFYGITVDNCVFHDINDAAIKIQMNEGGKMDGMQFSNLIFKDVISAVFMTFNNYTVYVDGPPEPAPLQSMKNFRFSNFQITAKTNPKEIAKPLIMLTGLPGHPIENVTFSNIAIMAQGGGSVADGAIRSIPELARVRPEFTQFGKVVPAYGIYARHVKGLAFDHIVLETHTPEHRPAVICDDVSDLEFSDSKVAASAESESAIRLQNVQRAWIRNSRAVGRSPTWVQVEGTASKEILLTGNDLRNTEKLFTVSLGATNDAVTAKHNTP